MVKSCYIHIPFCKSICSYCDFCKQFYDKKKVKDYLVKLLYEIKREYKGDILDTIYIGGGTPTCLDINELELLFKMTDSLNKNSVYEFTMEANVETLTEDKLKLMKKHGVNRLSIGIESIETSNIRLLERCHNKKDILEKISLARKVGFNNINVDLIYAIYGESIDDLKRDIDFILSLDIQHISTYSLMIEDHTKLKINGVKAISDIIDQEMYNYIIKILKNNHYIHYEISNFSKEGYKSKHNLCYWHNEEYYGFGMGAASYINGVRSCNTKSLKNYPNKKIEEEILNIDDKIEYEIILNLRLKEGLSLDRFKKKYGKDLNEFYSYSKLIDEGLLLEENNVIMIPEKFWYVSNEVLAKLLQSRI